MAKPNYSYEKRRKEIAKKKKKEEKLKRKREKKLMKEEAEGHGVETPSEEETAPAQSEEPGA